MPCIQRTTAVFFGFFLQSAAFTRAQQVEPIVTDRPTQTAAPYVLSPLFFQLEAGYKFSRFEEGSVRADVHELPDVLIRFGVLKRIEARLIVTGWNFRAIDFLGGSVNDNFFKDINVGAKIALAEEQGPRPAISLLGGCQRAGR